MGKAIIVEISPGSLAEELNLEPGDKILKINKQEPEDLIDFQILWADEEVELLIEKKNKNLVLYEIEKDIDEGLGVKFGQAVFNRVYSCHNKCLFCFIDQMAPLMRKSLYQKDDDYRLSFLQGNFITLTNLRDLDLERIKKLHLSPLYVSVHTTDPDLRAQVLGNPKAALIMEQLKDLINAGIKIHTQIVLCPGINDGIFLDKTIADLSSLWPGIQSIAIVPVGITKFRKDFDKFPELTKEYAKQLIKKISLKKQHFKQKFAHYLVYLADEFYIKAGLDFPQSSYYEDFPQIENGIGLARMFIDEFNRLKTLLPKEVSYREYTIITSVLGQSILEPIIKELSLIKGLKLNLISVNNCFFGPRVTIAGLLTGSDILMGLKDINAGSKIIISDIMLKNGENIFLDGLTTNDVEEQLNINLIVVNNSAKALLNQLLYEPLD